MLRRTSLALAAFFTTAFLVSVWHVLHSGDHISTFRPTAAVRSDAHLHFLIVATSSTDENLCRLLLSASILSYPSPILIDWAGEGEYDAAQTHLAKVAGPLRYLESLSPEQDSDIVLMVDGFDVMVQLGPDVLLKRYFKEIAAANLRLEARFGLKHLQKHNIYNSILFGPDKVCWPDNFRRAACWAVPDSSLPQEAFGPYTDMWMGDMPHARPRWLNSGTIMGPVADLRAMFRATQERIHRTWDADYHLHNSDQLYFADLWADQEYARTQAFNGKGALPIPEDVKDGDKPTLDPNRETEYHMGLDYESSLFQTVAGYTQYLTWMSFDRAPLAMSHATIEPYRINIQQDVLDSRKPFAAIQDDQALMNTSWRQIPLGVNTVTGQAFPILHFTGDKSLRDLWWTRMWYHAEAERLRITSPQLFDAAIGSETINGVNWFKHEPLVSSEGEKGDRSGAVSDTGGRLSWNDLCSMHETALYRKLSDMSTD